MILPSGLDANAALSLLAAVAYAVSAAGAVRLGDRGARYALVAAWLLHLGALGASLSVQPLRFGFAPALSVTAWLVLTVYAVERQVFPQLQARWALAGLGDAAVLLALVIPGTPLHNAASPLLPLRRARG